MSLTFNDSGDVLSGAKISRKKLIKIAFQSLKDANEETGESVEVKD